MKKQVCEFIQGHQGCTYDVLKKELKNTKGLSVCLKSLVSKGNLTKEGDIYTFVSMPTEETKKEPKLKITSQTSGIKKATDVDLLQMMATLREEMAELKKEAAMNLVAAKAQKEAMPLYKNKPIAANAVPRNDLLDEPVVFYAFRSQFIIMDDKKNGFVIRTPYGTPICFKFRSQTPRQTHGRADYSYICYCDIYSKEEAEFLRNHSLYGIGGIGFYEKIGNIKQTDMEIDEFKWEAYQQILPLTENEVIRKAESTPGIKMSDKIPDLRVQLVEVIAGQLMNKKSGQIRSVVESNMNMYEQAGKDGHTHKLQGIV